ncbi:immunoglobulin superfamily member 10 [Chanos chanos]|uniref:immunoglobulin superfamily member 10 n=1 Tax=Chanos chanos TaxID=29144 RepID=UPI0011F2C3BC|nr:immunoglobulin superfamily member 10-like [Chanos chanos]
MSAQSYEASYLRWKFLALLFILGEAIWKSSACPKSCACYVPTEVHCTFRYLTAIPTEIQPTVERINLGYNSLTVLREHDFSGLEHLELLMLHSNTIQNIEDRAFHDLKSLQVLKMSYNRVKELKKETFRGLNNLLRLHMDHNRIEFINPETFYGLTSLQLVHLEGNLLQQLHPDTFITLRHSQIFEISSVKTIYLSDNVLTSLPTTIFAGCHQLENVYLHGNPWSCDCQMNWFTEWADRNPGVLKCKRDRNYARGQLCPICETPKTSRGRNIAHLSHDHFTCTKPWIHMKQKNITLDEGDFTPVFPKDFIAPIGMLEMNVTDQFHNDASVSCVIQRPSGMENLTVSQSSNNEDVMTLSAVVTTSLVCNIDYEHIRQLWSILATYSDSPMKLERGLLLTRSPEMIFQYRQQRPDENDVFTDIVAEIKASPGWLMQGEITLQLDRTTTTYSTLHIKYRSLIQLNVESKRERKDRYSWAMIKKDNQTKTEHTVLIGGLAELDCQTFGDPKPMVEWILPDGSKIRAPYYSEDRRIVISDNGKLTLRAADSSDAGLYRCIATNYLDGDVLTFRVTVLSPDVEEEDVNGVQLSLSQGQNLVLNCESTGSPEASVQWILPDNTVLDKSYGNRKLYKNGTLGIHGLTERDRGFYRCLAANYLGADLLASQITITNEGKRGIMFTDTEASEAVTGVMPLLSDKNPNVTPMMDGPSPRAEPVVHTSIDPESQTTFTAVTTTQREQDEITFHTTQKIKSSTENTQLKPRIVGGNAASFTVLSSSDAFLPCEAAGEPVPTITWRRFSSRSTFTIKGKMGKFEVFKNGTLFIQNANIKDRGQYLCLAENDYGSDKLLVTLSVVAYPSRILEPKVREIKVHSGDTVEMKCKAEGRPLPLVSWILANRTQVRGQNTEHERVTVTPQGTLVIQQVSVYDRGHYKCIASNPAGADTATVRLQVVAAPPGILEDKRQQVKAHVGQNLWLPCTANGDPQPTTHWVLVDGTVVRPLRYIDSKVSAFSNGTLLLKDLDITDSGKYECIATSSTGSERRVVTLTVEKTETAPQITATSQHITELSYGDRLYLNCSAIGDPKPRIIWRLPSKALVDQWHRMGSRMQVLENGTLIIDSVSEKDAGDYLCVARNKVGDDLQLLKVTVSMKPAKIEPKVYGKKQVPYGNDLKVDCKASGAPVPEISWGLPDGTLLNSALQADSSGGSRSKRYILFDNGTLYLNKVGMAEEGDYTCYAENTLGKDEMHVHITVVTAAPRIRQPSHTYVKVKPGGNIRFDCEAVGEPKPKILWMLPSNDMIAASNERYLMHVNGSLDIRDIKLVDSGEYVCMARNTAGEDSKVYKLDIDGNPPIINGYYQNRTVVKDTAAKYSRKLIDCKAAGDPPPQITWIMPDNIFLTAPYYGSRINVHHNGTLEIRNVRPTDTAEFICMARNDGGEAVMVVQLEVTSMLRRPIFKNPFNERVVTHVGKTTVLNCSADGQPTPEITWLLPNGTHFVGGSDRDSKYHQGNDGSFVIYKPSKEDAGKYRCAAKNKVGYIEKLIVLEVGQKPFILTRPRGIIRSVAGDPLFLHCLADGIPRPNIFWTLPGGHILSRPQFSGRYQVMDNGTLVIRDTTLHDRGNYHCRAKSVAGEAVLTIPVIIIAYPPRITSGPPPSMRAVASSPVQLNCVAVGIPKPDITWELPDRSVLTAAGQGRPAGSELLHPQGTLIIQNPTRADSGTYKCLAKNALGMDTKVTYLRVM